MQSDEAIPWQILPMQPCRSCGSIADYMTLGHMYRMHCSSCGKEELGMFSPPFDPDLPIARPYDVFIDCSAVTPSAGNMLLFSKLHRSLSHLKPFELKALISSGKQHFVGQLAPRELEELQSAASGSAFSVVAHESEPAPHG